MIGHEHPAISLRDGPRVETVKCFLVGKSKGKTIIVLPSFNLVHEGTDVLKEMRLGPILPKDIKKFDVYIVSDNVYHFGKIKKLMSAS